MTRLIRNPDFDTAEFLTHFWQQKPLVIRNFFSNFEDPLQAEELAGLALDETVESRLVDSSAAPDYTLRHGPFQASDFLTLADDNWTLLVQAVDQLLPAVAALKTAFSFLPSWRIDDVMVSHAVPGGGVGPHLDQYDVFLLQGAGRRRWQLGAKGSEASLEVSDSGLRLLKDFKAEQEVILECGDILYIPPGFAHWGVAEQAGLCYSIGFRAPSQAELVEAFSDLVIDQQHPFDRFQDPDQDSQQPGEISPTSLALAWESLKKALNQQALFERAFGQWVSSPRYPEQVCSPGALLTMTDLQASVSAICRNPASRFAWFRSREEANCLSLFVDGELYSQPQDNLDAVIALCDLSIENFCDMPPAQHLEDWQRLLLELLNRGSLFLEEAH